jgi:hypothetical protein
LMATEETVIWEVSAFVYKNISSISITISSVDNPPACRRVW